ncbi:hypothetical protein ALP45_200085 [Pseudomonas coronafaciens pv. atropurpurea]|nr:hypothetical protein ALP45_200085 [Pseudomonas coronafaciens pv. atropurpurea]
MSVVQRILDLSCAGGGEGVTELWSANLLNSGPIEVITLVRQLLLVAWHHHGTSTQHLSDFTAIIMGSSSLKPTGPQLCEL